MATDTVTFQVSYSPEADSIIAAIARGEQVHPATVLYTATRGTTVVKTTVGEYLRHRDELMRYFDSLPAVCGNGDG